ncbi:MAG: Crp/Fnr family transcriptional regulator, partial [Cyanobacteriota bacterium]|nr:Crp/Fnr family transcriptional regulator [Cyanobacteriota bacterium]
EIIGLKCYRFKSREFIPVCSNTLWFLKRGAVRTLEFHEDGTCAVLGYWGVGDTIGQPLSRLKDYQMECVTPVEACCIPWQPSNWLFTKICHAMRETEELVGILRVEPVAQRFLKVLGWLARKFGCSVEQGQRIELRLTHQEVAELLGTTRVTVTRIVNQFERDGLIARCDRKLILKAAKPLPARSVARI